MLNLPEHCSSATEDNFLKNGAGWDKNSQCHSLVSRLNAECFSFLVWYLVDALQCPGVVFRITVWIYESNLSSGFYPEIFISIHDGRGGSIAGNFMAFPNLCNLY